MSYLNYMVFGFFSGWLAVSLPKLPQGLAVVCLMVWSVAFVGTAIGVVREWKGSDHGA